MFGDTCWDTLVKVVAHPAGGGDKRIAAEIAGQYPGTPRTPREETGIRLPLRSSTSVPG